MGFMKTKRNLSGIFFRVRRGDKFENICFEDLNADEQCQMMKRQGKEWLMNLSQRLADVLNEVGMACDIEKKI